MIIMTKQLACFLPLLLASLTSVMVPGAHALSEQERMAEYHKRNHTWPADYVPKNEGWKKLMDHRFRQAAEIEDSGIRYEAFVQTINAALVAPNFTEHGFGLARAPDDLMEALRQGIKDGLEAGPEFESNIEVIKGDPPWFINRPDLTQRVLNEIQHYPETWAGMELTPSQAYGFRLYRNNSELYMHVDKSQTHVISFILHIDSSEDAEPWPILIEDFDGNTHEVILTSGDILFYESSKCFHGRPHKFKGSWYSSVFVHYYPKYGWAESDHNIEKHYAIPPSWKDQPTSNFEVPLEMRGTGMTEPSCTNNWCATDHTIKWSGPAEKGYWHAPNMEKYPFEPKKIVCEDSEDLCSEWVGWDTDECKRNAGFMLVNCKKSCGACTGAPNMDEL